jgi:hypothetical protein
MSKHYKVVKTTKIDQRPPFMEDAKGLRRPKKKSVQDNMSIVDKDDKTALLCLAVAEHVNKYNIFNSK